MERLTVVCLSVLFCLVLGIAMSCGSSGDDDGGISNSPGDCEKMAETIFTECRVALGNTSWETPGLINDAQDYCHAHSTEVAECLETWLSSNACDPEYVSYSYDYCCMTQAGCFSE